MPNTIIINGDISGVANVQAGGTVNQTVHYHLESEIKNSKISLDTNKPNYLEKQYSYDIFRKKTYDSLFSVLNSEEESNSLCIVYGAAGIGKSSFMATSFNQLASENFSKIIYFIEDSTDDLHHLEQVYHLIENNFIKEFKQRNIDLDFNMIYGDNNIVTKLEYIFNLYSKNIYLDYTKPFILMIDGLDTLVDSKKFILDLVKNYVGIHFIFSTRKNFKKDTYVKLKQNNKGLFIYNKEDKIGIALENLNQNDTSLYFEKIQALDNFLDKDKISCIKEKVYEKSKGLPKYFELLIKKINKLTTESENSLYERVNEYINKLPEDLEEFYIEEFKSIEQQSQLSLEILIVFYWHNKVMKKSTLMNFIKEKNINVVDDSLNMISHFLNSSKEEYNINHLSIKEALFTYFQKDNFQKLTAIRLEENFIKKTFQNETPILKSLADNDSKVYELFSSIYYMENNNILFNRLKSIVEISLQNKFLQKNQDILPLYFNFSRILFAQDMISSEILSHNDFKVTELFQKNQISENTKKISLNVLALYSNSHGMNIHDLRLLLSLAILGQNNYFISKYLKEYKKIRHNEKYNEILTDDLLNKDKYNNLNSISSKTYVSMYSKFTKKQLDSTLDLYEDSGLILLYDNTWSNDTNRNIMNVLIQAQQGRKQRNFYEKQIRIYQTLKHSTNIELKKYFYNAMYNYVKKNDLLSNKMIIFLNQVSYDILLQGIESFSFSNKMYKYLYEDKKARIDIVYQFFILYKEHLLETLLKHENLDFFHEIVYFIKTEDTIEFITFYINHSDKRTSLLIDIIIRKESNKEILIFCEQYLSKKEIVSLTASIIYYKLGEIEKLGKTILQIESEREERTLLHRVSNSLDKELLDIYPSLSKRNYAGDQFLIKYLEKSTFSLKELDFFGRIISQKDSKLFSKHLSETSFTLDDSKQIKQIFLYYKEFLKDEDIKIILLNIIRLDSFDNFVEQFNDLNNNLQIAFLYQVLKNYLKTKERMPQKLLHLLFTAILNSSFNKDVYQLLLKIYKRQKYIDFCIENYQFIEQIYLSVDSKLSEDVLKTKALLYKLSINYRPEDEYFELLQKEWISEEIKSRIAMVFIVKMKNKKAMQKLSTYCQSLDRATVLIHMGIMFDNREELKEGINLLYQFKNEKTQNIKYFENYLEFTLIHNSTISKNSSNFIKSTFIPKYKNKTLLSTFLNIEKFISTNEFLEDYIQFPKEFLENYLFYSKFENKIDNNTFDDISKVTLENLAILYDQYKEAEEKEDEENYNKCENIFSSLQNEYVDIFNEYFNEVETLSLDNMFSRVKYSNVFPLEFLTSDYSKFYEYIEKIYDDYMSNNREKIDDSLNQFNVLKEKIIKNEDYMNVVKEKSYITSTLAFKLDNIELFKPRDEEY